MRLIPQKTLQSEVAISGVGLFTGAKADVRLLPARENSGIVFQRVDLPGKPEIPAHYSFVKEAPRCTRLATADASVQLVEHLLSALYAMGIDNARIEITGPEVPVFDGSAKTFVERIVPKEQSAPLEVLQIVNPVYLSLGETQIVALPADEFRISYTMHYPHSAKLGSQFHSFSVTHGDYQYEIAPCRTFALYEEIVPLLERGILKGGGLENGLVIRGDEVLNPEGTRFPDEMVRHKILDVIGDLALIGKPILAHIIAIRSGHAANAAFARLLDEQAVEKRDPVELLNLLRENAEIPVGGV
jgi:UDP-3-O-[3-hydroxymyristoyl] N-acetylglucosamine deacetylase